MKAKDFYNVAVYLRLFKDDGEAGKAESNSITSQRDIIRSFIRKQDNMEIFDFYVDDGWSGANFDRPAFKRMMGDIESGHIDCVIVKDLSRLGRDYIGSGRLIQKTFPEHEVRFIAINDNYDSLTADFNEESLVLPVKNFINDAYCRDISVKVKSQQKMKRESGQYIGAFAMYGYRKDPDDKNHLIIDKYAAGIIESIFEWKVDGYSFEAIADRLNGMGVLSPMEYKRSNGEKFTTGFRTKKRSKWSAQAVRRILMDETYIGTLVQGKSERVNYKVKKSVVKPAEEWVRVPNAHEAIISKDLFEVVQQLLKTDCRSASGKNTSHLYSGLLFCGDCGEQMTRRVNRYKGQTKVYFICSNYNKNKKCSRHSILQDDLDRLVLYGIKSRVELILDQMAVISKVKDLDMRYDDIVAFDKEIVDLKAEQEKYKKLRAALYEDYKKGIIGEEDFKTFSAIYEEKYAAIESDLEKQMQNLKELFKNGLEAGMKLEQYKDVLQVESLNRTTLVHLVEKIYVYDDKRVHVVLRHQNQFIKVAMLCDFLKHSEAEGKVK